MTEVPEAPRLGALERQVLDTLWDHGSQSIREIIERLGRVPAYTTIATVLHNLERKGLVTSERNGRAVHYLATRTREVHAAQLMELALAGSGDRAASILHFVDTMDAREAQLLRDYLARRSAGE